MQIRAASEIFIFYDFINLLGAYGTQIYRFELFQIFFFYCGSLLDFVFDCGYRHDGAENCSNLNQFEKLVLPQFIKSMQTILQKVCSRCHKTYKVGLFIVFSNNRAKKLETMRFLEEQTLRNWQGIEKKSVNRTFIKERPLDNNIN